MRHLLFAAAAALAFSACTADPPSDDYPFPTGDEPLGKADSITNLPVLMNPPIAGTFAQQVDHPRGGAANTLGTFSQRFWYSTQFAKGNANAPVLFYFCGEAACDPAYAATMADAAMALDASVVVLEHRFYGTSMPFPDESADHMKYLTVHNAIEDAAAFETWAKTNIPLGGKWIAVGGSYAGMLAAFYREKHPELVVGAWSSSAPVEVQLAFTGYDQITTKALGPTCALLFQQMLGNVGSIYDAGTAANAAPQATTDLNTLETFFYGAAQPQMSKADILTSLSGVAEGAAQYGLERNLCAALLQDSDNPLMGFEEYLVPPLVVDNGSGSGSGTAAGSGSGTGALAATPSSPAPSRGKIMTPLVVPASLDSFAGSEWFYQVCTEVGFFQIANTDRSASIMSNLITTQYFSNLCQQYVGAQPAIDVTRSEFLDPLTRGDVSNVLFVSGTDDPWMPLTITDASNAPNTTPFMVATGSHCEDLEELTTNSVLGVFKAHKLFHDLAVTWVK